MPEPDIIPRKDGAETVRALLAAATQRRIRRVALASLKASRHLSEAVTLLGNTVRDEASPLKDRFAAAKMLWEIARSDDLEPPPEAPSLHLHLSQDEWLKRVNAAVEASNALAVKRAEQALPEGSG